jgi:hypothetical protein
LLKFERHNTFVFVVDETQPVKQLTCFRGVLIQHSDNSCNFALLKVKIRYRSVIASHSGDERMNRAG